MQTPDPAQPQAGGPFSARSGYTLVPKWRVVLESLDPQQREVLSARLVRIDMPPRTTVFRQGDPSDRLLVVESGRVRVFQTSQAGETFTQGICIGGTSIGLAALTAEKRRDTSAETIDRCTLQTMRGDDFRTLMRSMPGFGAGVAKLLATTAMESFARTGSLAGEPVRVRLSRMLISLAQSAVAPDHSSAFQVEGISQEDLARMVGVSRTWVVLTLKMFEERGLVTRHRRRILFPDWERMNRYVQDERTITR